jgi:hypothetical protein
MSDKISRKINFIGIFALVSGIVIGLWFVTAGLLMALMVYAMSKAISIFLFLIGGIAFSVMLIKGGIGIRRRRPWSRLFLIIIFYLASAGIIVCIFSSTIERLQGIGGTQFDVSWIGGVLIGLFGVTLCVFQGKFLSRPDVKELFKIREDPLM